MKVSIDEIFKTPSTKSMIDIDDDVVSRQSFWLRFA